MWLKYGLKAQKLIAQGIALGMMAISKAPCKGKSLMVCLKFLKLLPLQGDRFASVITQGDALGYGLLPLQGVWSLQDVWSLHAKLELLTKSIIAASVSEGFCTLLMAGRVNSTFLFL